MLLLDATHTSHTRAQTGIQRVTRSLFAELAKNQPTTGVCYDPYLRAWRTLNSRELDHLRADQPAAKSRGSKWSLGQRLASHTQRLLGSAPALPAATGFVCPEIFSPKVAANLPAIFARVRGPRVALFHDAIGLQLPELTPPATVARLPAYLRELLQFDGIAAVSEASAASLRDYWAWLGVTDAPPVGGLPLGLADCHIIIDDKSSATPKPRVLCVGTIEGRKNHLALLEACEALWLAGLKFELELIGLARADTAAAALAKISALQQAGHPLFYVGSVPEAELHAAYSRCAFTVYPSLIEGFGLPVFESLGHGKPCLCSAHGALGEAARGGGDKGGSLGGCVALDRVDAPSLAAAIRRLLENPAELTTLSAVARARPLRTWRDYATDLTAWMGTLPRRA